LFCSFAHLFAKLPQSGTAKGTMRSSCQAVTSYNQSNHSNVKAIPLIALPKDTTSKLACLSPHYPVFYCWASKEAVNTNF